MICIIPARKGSKGLPGKNVRLLFGKPLILWTIDAALDSKCFEKIIITTDDERIIGLCSDQEGVIAHQRPAEFATDTTTMQAVVSETILNYPSENYALLQPTSPLRNRSHIIEAQKLFFTSERSSLVSMTQVNLRPSLYYINDSEKGLLQIFSGFTTKLQRQFDPPIMKENGAIYMYNHDFFSSYGRFFDHNAAVFKMNEEHSVDIDTIFDFRLVEKFLARDFSPT